MSEKRIKWQPGFTLSKKPTRRATARRATWKVNAPAQFQSVAETSGARYEPAISLSHTVTSKAFQLGGLAADSVNDVAAQSSSCDSDEHVWSPLGVLYNSLSHRYEPVIRRYNAEFCKIPLTTDLRTNPFQFCMQSSPAPLFLTHAALALAGHHVLSAQFQDHRQAALQALRKGLDEMNSAHFYQVLDTIILLFSLDEAQSAYGNWSVHLSGAYALLEACGGIEEWTKSNRAIVQVGMLVWWDAITSLVSREDCVFPYSYFEAVMMNYDRQGWDYFGLCGCPVDLVKLVMRLARLNAEKKRSLSMKHVVFDDSAVAKLENELEAWYHVPPSAAYVDEESMHLDRDNMHCAEAWRSGMLLYLYRVFRWERSTSFSMRALVCARTVADHIFACRDNSMIARQALLPLFFAGCELQDVSIRKRILQLCRLWNDRTRYYMFGTTIPLLRDVWAEQEKGDKDAVWWGHVVDNWHRGPIDSPLRSRLCFG